jgi:hypothetical protein
MSHDLVGAYLAVKASERHVLSARPQAPTVPGRPRRHPVVAVRKRTAVGLRRLAGWVEPHRRPAPRLVAGPGSC